MHEVRADDLVSVEQARELELRADAVGRRDERHIRSGRCEETPELPDVADDLGPLGARDALADATKGVRGTPDVDPGALIRQAHTRTFSDSSESLASSSCTGTR